MNKTLLIILSLVAVILGVLMLWYFFSRTVGPVQEAPTNVGLPIAPQNAGSTSSSKLIQKQQLSLAVTSGGSITVLNFLDDPEIVADPVNSGYYDLGYSTTNTPPFMITYIATTQYFNIELLQEPIGQTREFAQQYLEQHLGISESDLCRLRYTVSAPSNVSSLYGGASLGFSFCPGATVLPK